MIARASSSNDPCCSNIFRTLLNCPPMSPAQVELWRAPKLDSIILKSMQSVLCCYIGVKMMDEGKKMDEKLQEAYFATQMDAIVQPFYAALREIIAMPMLNGLTATRLLKKKSVI